MNFENIEDLTVNELNNLYDDVIENNNFFATCIWEMRCTNGKDGYFLDYRPGDCYGHDFYGCNGYGDAVRVICGYSGCGAAYGVAPLDPDRKSGVIWKVTCENRNTGYFFDYRPGVWNGSIGDSWSGNNGESTNKICGYGRYGTAVVHTQF